MTRATKQTVTGIALSLLCLPCLFLTINLLLAHATKAAAAAASGRIAAGQWMQTAGPNTSNVAVLVASGANLFAVAGNQVFLSTTSGQSWTASSNGLPGAVVNSFNNGQGWTAAS